MKKALIIGGNGFVGGRLLQAGGALGYECAVADTAEKAVYSDARYYRCDITQYEQTEGLFLSYRPDLVINVAAIANVDVAEKSMQLAKSVNVFGAANCARAAVASGSQYVWFSSDAVFDGKQKGYREDSPTGPVNYYGMTKAWGERAVFAQKPDAIIPRFSLILGLPVVKGNSFVAGLKSKLAQGEFIDCPVNEVRTPIDVYTLCSAIFELYALGFGGLIHLGATESIDRYTLTQKLCAKLGGNMELVRPSFTADTKRAPRHDNGVLYVDKAVGALRRTKLCDVNETVNRALRDMRDTTEQL